MAEKRERMESETGGNGVASEKWPKALVCLVYLVGLVYLVDMAGRAGRAEKVYLVRLVRRSGTGATSVIART